MRDPTQSQLTRWRSPSKVVSWTVVERFRQAVGAVRSRSGPVGRPVEQVGHAMPAAERVIDLDAELVGLLDRAAVFGREVVVDVAECARDEPLPVGHQHRPGQRDVLLRHGAESLDRNPVVRERVADEPRAIRVGARRRRIVDGDSPPLAVDPVREVSVPHFRRGHAAEGGVAARLVVEPLVRREEERAVPSVVHARDPDRPAERSPVVPLLVDALRLLEEALLVQRIVTEEPVPRSLQDVGA